MGMVFGRIAEELPRHSIVSKHATYQIRRYEPSIAVQCDYSRGWGNSSDGTPFGSLARYIGVFSEPENVKRQPIAMTAPVLIDAGTEKHTMMFLLPASKYSSIDAAPKPSNVSHAATLHQQPCVPVSNPISSPRVRQPNVRLQTLPARLQAVRTFSGNLRPSKARSEMQLLLEDLKRDGWHVKTTSSGVEWQAAGYNAPFVIPFLKTNEVMISVDEK